MVVSSCLGLPVFKTLAGTRRYFLFIMIWLLYVTLVQMAFESNLRANLIKVKLEKAVDSDKELSELGIPLYFDESGTMLSSFEQSPLRHRRLLAEKAKTKNHLYECSSQACPNLEEIDAVIGKGEMENSNFPHLLGNIFVSYPGGGITLPKNSFFGLFGVGKKRYNNTKPFHLSAESFASPFCTIYVNKGMSWKNDVSQITLR